MANLARQPWSRWFVFLAVILACALSIGWLQSIRLQTLQADREMVSVDEIRRATAAEQTRLSLLRQLPAFGFDNVVADWTFLNFLQYFGDDVARRKTDYALSPEFFEVILARDPYFLEVYPFLSTSTSIYAGMPDRAVALMQRALQSLKPNVPPRSYFAWRQLGIDQLLFLGDAPAAQRSFETAAQWASQSSLPESQHVAEVSEQTARFLADNPNSKTAQISAWVMVLNSAPDDRTRQTAIQQITALGGNIAENPDGTVTVQPPAE
ncbi:MAG: hypothetical protein IGS38_16335 [Synechococcales cyanobacterium M58_A2018_015]|nr:hypothetical protein [Synechococcales cyanobacterium M58_A2018_015]